MVEVLFAGIVVLNTNSPDSFSIVWKTQPVEIGCERLTVTDCLRVDGHHKKTTLANSKHWVKRLLVGWGEPNSLL